MQDDELNIITATQFFSIKDRELESSMTLVEHPFFNLGSRKFNTTHKFYGTQLLIQSYCKETCKVETYNAETKTMHAADLVHCIGSHHVEPVQELMETAISFAVHPNRLRIYTNENIYAFWKDGSEYEMQLHDCVETDGFMLRTFQMHYAIYYPMTRKLEFSDLTSSIDIPANFEILDFDFYDGDHRWIAMTDLDDGMLYAVWIVEGQEREWLQLGVHNLRVGTPGQHIIMYESYFLFTTLEGIMTIVMYKGNMIDAPFE